MPDQGPNYNPLLFPLMAIMSSRGDVEQQLGEFAKLIQATQEALRTMKSGVETFHASLLQFSQAQQPPKVNNPSILPVRDKWPKKDEVSFNPGGTEVGETPAPPADTENQGQ